MLSLVVLAVLVAGASPLPADTRTRKQPSETPPLDCCMPLALQAAVIDLKSDEELVTIVAVDYENKLEGFWTTWAATGELDSHMMFDYNQGVLYEAVYDPGEPPACNKLSLDLPWIRCMNDSGINELTYLGSNTVGMKGNGIDYHEFSYRVKDFEVKVALTSLPGDKNLCYPVLESIKNNELSTTFIYLDVETEIKDHHVLSVPELCVGL
ncbi:hypothetical protein RRG08_053550 [Elysia crispata]|uniref:Uncharacterized protein n=1 Tax=Elysia crispata TaxID=231223 RepID=A0AAE0Y1L6_9GAST|nr:hypothetical protein RRG08_053550 [Elysia crispata]